MKKTLAQTFVEYLEQLKWESPLPEGVSILNPMEGNPKVRDLTQQFYNRFYNDYNPRTLILGINPGRLGGGATGIPFTDTKRLKEKCGMAMEDLKTHEPSSVFVYEWIDAMGGPDLFYNRFFIHSVCPLGFVKGKVNYNYYDDKKLETAALPEIKRHLTALIKMGFERERVFCLGTGKNYAFLNKLNATEKYFENIIPLEHPRFIMQYKSKIKDQYIADFIQKMNDAV